MMVPVNSSRKTIAAGEAVLCVLDGEMIALQDRVSLRISLYKNLPIASESSSVEVGGRGEGMAEADPFQQDIIFLGV